MGYCFNLETKEYGDHKAIRELLPQVLLPELLERWGDSALPWVYVQEAAPQSYDLLTQFVIAGDPAKGEGGQYYQTWVVESISQDILDERAVREEQRLIDIVEWEEAAQEKEVIAAAHRAVEEAQRAVALLKRSLDTYFDGVAKEQGFENGRTSLVTRAAYPNKWQGLATAFGTWMDECNDLADTASLSPEGLIASFTPFTFK